MHAHAPPPPSAHEPGSAAPATSPRISGQTISLMQLAITNSGGQSSANMHGHNYLIILSTPILMSDLRGNDACNQDVVLVDCKTAFSRGTSSPLAPRRGRPPNQWRQRGVRAAVASRSSLQHWAKNIKQTSKQKRGLCLWRGGCLRAIRPSAAHPDAHANRHFSRAKSHLRAFHTTGF